MNSRFLKFLIATKSQTFVSTLYNFGFMIIFYQLTNNLVLSSAISAITIVVTKLITIIIVPKMKYKNQIKISSISNLALAVISFLSIPFYIIFKEAVIFYFILKIIISSLEEIDNSFQYSVIPCLVGKDYLYKANSLNGMVLNISSIIAPLLSYIFYQYSNFSYFLFIYGIINLFSGLILSKIEFKNEQESKINENEKLSILNEWGKTIKIISSNPDIVFCISIAVCINLIFGGLNGPILLSMGEISSNKVFGQTIIKTLLSLGSFIGIFGVYNLKVKEHYIQYLKVSIIGLIIVLAILGFSTNALIIYGSFFVLSIFIMFVMNSTGTKLQLSTPKEELTSVYTFNISLLSIVVPLSYLISGCILQYRGRRDFFIFSIALLLITVGFNILLIKYYNRRTNTKGFSWKA